MNFTRPVYIFLSDKCLCCSTLFSLPQKWGWAHQSSSLEHAGLWTFVVCQITAICSSKPFGVFATNKSSQAGVFLQHPSLVAEGPWEAPEVPLHCGADQGVAGSHPQWVVFVHIVKPKAISGALCERQKERTKFTPKPHVVATFPLGGVSLGSQQACC